MRIASVAACVLALGSCAGTEPKPPFDGVAALGYIKTQMDFGPRIPGSIGWKKTGDWIVEMMKTRADTVLLQEWQHTTLDGTVIPMRNILARIRPGAARRVLYVTHWDTRPVSDEAIVPAQRTLPVPGANDGASGVALFIALGDALKKVPPTVGVDLLFVDGEDYGSFDDSTRHDVLIGSQYFADHLPSADYQPLFGVLWDMIGDADLRIRQEGHSIEKAPEVVSRVWSVAKSLGYGSFFVDENEGPITDDHLPLLAAGLRVIDVIDIHYPREGANYHHTPLDLIDKVSAASLKIVGDVAMALVTRD